MGQLLILFFPSMNKVNKIPLQRIIMKSFNQTINKFLLALLLMPGMLLAESNAELVSGINESLKSGKIVKAQQLASKLYKADKGKTANFTFLAANVAAMSGDKATAVKRYLSFIASGTAKNANTRKALTYLLINNPNTALLERFVKEYGAYEIVQTQGLKVLSSLLENDDSQGATKLATLLVNTFKSAVVDGAVVGYLRNNSRVFVDKNSQTFLFKFFTAAKHLNPRSAYDIIRSFERTIAPADLMAGVADIQLSTGKPVYSQFSYYFGKLSALKSDQKEIALKFLAHDKVCTEAHFYFDYLNFISRYPKVFKKSNGQLIDGSKVTDKVAALLKLYDKASFYKGNITVLTNQLAGAYFDKAGQKVFLKPYKNLRNGDYRAIVGKLNATSPLLKSIKLSVQQNRYGRDKKLNAALAKLKVADMVSGKDGSVDGKAVKFLHDAHLNYAQSRGIYVYEYVSYWAPYLGDSEVFWELALRNLNMAKSYPRGLTEKYLTHLDKTKSIPDYGLTYLKQTSDGIKDPSQLKWLRTQYAKLGDTAFKVISRNRWKIKMLLPEALQALKSVKGDIDPSLLYGILRPLIGQKLTGKLTAKDLETVLASFKNQPISNYIILGQVIVRGYDRATVNTHLEKMLSNLQGLDKFKLINDMYTNRDFNNYRATIEKELQKTMTQVKESDWEKLNLNVSLVISLDKLKSAVAETLLTKAANNEIMLRSGSNYLVKNYYSLLTKKLAAGNWPELIPLIRSWAIAASPSARDRNFIARTLTPLFKKLEELKANEVTYFLSNLMLQNVKDLNAKKVLTKIRSNAASGIENLIPVDKSDKRYQLYIASESLALGDFSKAWQLTQPRLELLKTNWPEFDERYLVWVTGQLLEENEYKTALELAMTILLEEATLSRQTITSLALLKGDIYRAEENFPAARTEYQALVNNLENKKTAAGQKARYRLVDLMIQTKDYASAELDLARMVDSSSLETQAEANYYLGKLYYTQKEYITANEYLQKTFKRMHGHVAGRLLEGELKLYLPRGLADTEIAVGRLDLQTVVIPGSVLTLKLQDRNLAIARGGKAIPVDIVTSSGDKESLALLPSESDPTLFVGQMPSVLGKIVAGNGKLEIRGDDSISYAISKAFQKQNKTDYPSKEMVIKANATLKVSSGELNDKKKKKTDNEEFIVSKRDVLNKAQQVRPGSPVYIEVKDYDRDISSAKDKVSVDVRTSSGDVLSNLQLLETSEHSGIFRAVVKTGIPFPLVTASDEDENQDANAVINSGRNKVWSSIADSKKSKWLEVDTMSSYELKTVAIKLAKQNVKSMKLYGQLDKDQFLIGSYPKSSDAAGGLQASVVPGNYRSLIDLKKALRFQNKPLPLTTTELLRSQTAYGKRDAWTTTLISGTFWVDKAQDINLKFLHKPGDKDRQYTVLYLDGKRIMGYRGMNSVQFDKVSTLFLKKGPHKIEIFNVDVKAKSEIKLGYKKEDGSFESLPANWFSTAENPGLADLLKPKGILTKTANGFKVDMTSSLRLRKLRWSFVDYNGTNVEVSEISATDQQGKAVLPVAQDFTAGQNNDSLEVSAGDGISFKYNDEKRLGKALAVLQKKMYATFANAKINMGYEVEGQNVLAAAKRVRQGDQVLISVTDYDEDLTPKRDIVIAKVRTRSGAQMDLKLLETEINSGVFSQILGFGSSTGKDTIAIKDNDEITVSYLDKENNSPGIPTERMVKVETPVLGKPELTVYSTSVQQIEDNSTAAEVRKKRIMSLNPALKEVTLFKKLIIANDKHSQVISLNAPLLIKVLYPQVVRHSMSQYTIEAVTQSQMDASKKGKVKVDESNLSFLEREQLKKSRAKKDYGIYTPLVLKVGDISSRVYGAGYRDVSLAGSTRIDGDNAMEIGLLTTAVHLQLGSPGDIIEKSTDEDVATLIVSGRDTIFIRVKDDKGKVVIEEKIALRSDARIALFDRNYNYPVDAIHMGQRFFLQVNDPDQDKSNERDSIVVTVKTSSGQTVAHKLSETLEHSGIFTGPLKPKFVVKSKTGTPAKSTGLTAQFGDTLKFTYTDDSTLSGNENISISGRIQKGADGSMSVFTKRFKDENMAVKTRFLMAEALFEMAREHRKLKKIELADEELSRGKRILQEAIRDFPNSDLKVQGEYLLANLAQELKKYEEGLSRYSKVISNWPETEFASKSQFKKAICLEKMNMLDKAAEEYVKVTYLYPGSDLTPDAVIRMASLYFKQKKYTVASKIYLRFQSNYPDHKLASRAYFMAANCLILEQKNTEAANKLLTAHNEQFEKGSKRLKILAKVSYVGAIEILANMVETYKDDKKVRPEGMYWLGDCQYLNNEYTTSYQTFKKLTWDYPESKWAKIARGRLTDERFESFEKGLE